MNFLSIDRLLNFDVSSLLILLEIQGTSGNEINFHVCSVCMCSTHNSSSEWSNPPPPRQNRGMNSGRPWRKNLEGQKENDGSFPPSPAPNGNASYNRKLYTFRIVGGGGLGQLLISVNLFLPKHTVHRHTADRRNAMLATLSRYLSHCEASGSLQKNTRAWWAHAQRHRTACLPSATLRLDSRQILMSVWLGEGCSDI